MDKVQTYINDNKEQFVSELFDLLRIPSISAQSEHKEDMIRCAEHLAVALMNAGADRAEVMPTAGNPVVFAEKIVSPSAKTDRKSTRLNSSHPNPSRMPSSA